MALCTFRAGTEMARDTYSGLSQHAAETIVKNFLAAQRSHEESAQAQGSAIADLNGDGKPEIVLVWTTLGPTYWHNTLDSILSNFGWIQTCFLTTAQW